MRHITKVIAFITIAICLYAIFLRGAHALSDSSEQDASKAIASANQALQAAFVNVSDAEKSGVNVSVLIYELNMAGLNLTSAEAAFSNDDYSQVVSLATSSQLVADRVATDASAMKAQAPDWFLNFLPTLIIRSTVSGVFVLVLALIWLWFRGYYLRKMSESHPKVTAQ